MKCQWTVFWSRPALHMFAWLGEMELKSTSGKQRNFLQLMAQAITDCQQKASRHHHYHPVWNAPLPSNWLIQQFSFIPKVSLLLCLSQHVWLVLGSPGEQGWTQGHGGHSLPAPSSLLLVLTLLHQPPLIPFPKKVGARDSSFLFHRVLYSAAGWDKTVDYK